LRVIKVVPKPKTGFLVNGLLATKIFPHPKVVVFLYSHPASSPELWADMRLTVERELTEVILKNNKLPEAVIRYICAAVLRISAKRANRRCVKVSNISIHKTLFIGTSDRITSFYHQMVPSESAWEPSRFMQNHQTSAKAFLTGWPPKLSTERGMVSRWDVWSLGITILEMAEKYPPHIGTSPGFFLPYSNYVGSELIIFLR